MIKFWILFSLCILVQLRCPETAQASPENETESFCLVHHLQEAIALNRARLEAYSEMSDGASEKVSNLLILGERLALPGAFLRDSDSLP